MHVRFWKRQTASPPSWHSKPVQSARVMRTEEEDLEEERREDEKEREELLEDEEYNEEDKEPSQRIQGKVEIDTQDRFCAAQKSPPPIRHSPPRHSGASDEVELREEDDRLKPEENSDDREEVDDRELPDERDDDRLDPELPELPDEFDDCEERIVTGPQQIPTD
jgi:hypothetical protein